MTRHATAAQNDAHAFAAILDMRELLADVEQRMVSLAGNALVDPGARITIEHLAGGGKRLRASLALASCNAVGGRAEDAVDWAAAVELLHNASLIHDDVQDGDRVRRGAPAIWARHGAAQAINAGDLLLMLPFRALATYPAALQAELVQTLASAAEATVRGQMRELALAAATAGTWSDYFEAASNKTGSLFALPVQGALRVGGVDAETSEALASAFRAIGIVYQLQDDVLDLFGTKGPGSGGSDIYQGRLSAPLLAHFDLYPEERDDVVALLHTPRAATAPHEVDALIERLLCAGAAGAVLARIDLLADEVLESEPLVASQPMRELARELLHKVLAPLQSVRELARSQVVRRLG